MSAERLIEIIANSYTPTNIHRAQAESIFREFVVIPRSELPVVIPVDAVTVCVEDSTYSVTQRGDLRWKILRQLIAVAEYVDQQKAGRMKRDARRDELASSLVEDAYGDDGHSREYQFLSKLMRKAIDRIIDLEEGAS